MFLTLKKEGLVTSEGGKEDKATLKINPGN